MAMFMELSKTEIKNVAHKPCPFCGNTKLYISEQKNYEELCDENGHSMLSIECKVCKMDLKEYDIPNNNYWLGVGLLVGKWNRRNEVKEDAD